MSAPRTLARTTAALGAATALTVAGAGAAMATTTSYEVDGDTVSVTFELDGGLADADTCGAVLTPTSAVPGLVNSLTGGDVKDVFETLVDDDNVTVLYEDGLIANTPFVVLGEALGAGKSSGTVSAEDVPSNVYALVSMCTMESDGPTVDAPVLVGDPMEAVMGSIEMGSSNGGLDTASALLGDGGLDTASALLNGDGDSGILDGALLGDLAGSAGDEVGDEGETGGDARE